MESKGEGQASDEFRLRFLKCRRWHSREVVDVKMMLEN